MESRAQECSIRQGGRIKQREQQPLACTRTRSSASRRVQLSRGNSTMIPGCLSYLLLLPLGTCFPLLAGDGPVEAMGDTGGKMSWAGLAGGHRSPWGSSQGHRALLPHAPLVLATAEELQAAGREGAGFRFRVGRQDHSGGEAAGFLPADGEKVSGPLGTLAEELTSYSRKKGGFSFRFGRR